MSHGTAPISPSRFAAALRDLPVSTLHLKVVELRNSIAHLDYSNEQLKPYADGTAGAEGRLPGVPDQDCLEAIEENQVVIARMQERIVLVRAEVESRGVNWLEFRDSEEAEKVPNGDRKLVNGIGNAEPLDHDVNLEGGERSDAWEDGTIQTGRIADGEVGTSSNGSAHVMGGRFSDAALRSALEERMGIREDENGSEAGMHL